MLRREHANTCAPVIESASVESEIAWFVRCLVSGVPRQHKDVHLFRMWCSANKSFNTLTAATIFSHLNAKPTLTPALRAPFNINALSDQQCVSMFRFNKDEIGQLMVLMNIGTCKTRERTAASGIEALRIVLYKLGVPVRWADIEGTFGRSASGLSNIFLHLLQTLDDKFSSLLQFNRDNSANRLQEFADAVFAAGGRMSNVWSFIDGTVRGICRPRPHKKQRYISQQSVYNEHKHKHALKYQTLVTPDGMIAHLFGPFPGRNHDITMYCASKLADVIRADVRFRDFRIFGDCVYGRDDVVASSFAGAIGKLRVDQKGVNKSMSKVRVAVEWSYGQIDNY